MEDSQTGDLEDLAAKINAQLDSRLHHLDVAGERIGVCRSEVYKLIKSGELRSVKIGRRRLVSEQAIRDYIAQIDRVG